MSSHAIETLTTLLLQGEERLDADEFVGPFTQRIAILEALDREVPDEVAALDAAIIAVERTTTRLAVETIRSARTTVQRVSTGDRTPQHTSVGYLEEAAKALKEAEAELAAAKAAFEAWNAEQQAEAGEEPETESDGVTVLH